MGYDTYTVLGIIGITALFTYTRWKGNKEDSEAKAKSDAIQKEMDELYKTSPLNPDSPNFDQAKYDEYIKERDEELDQPDQ